MTQYLNGQNTANAVFAPHSQVYYASHELRKSNLNLNLAWYRKKYMDRSFISFSFGGRWIEDFNLIAVSGDRLQRELYGDFENVTTNYDILDGQFYWGTHFNNNSIEFTLATDSLTQAQLEDFKHWFAPGQTRELILAEHPNRAIKARLESSPSMSVIPFEQPIVLKIGGANYNTSTTVYRGEISVSFVMDEPYWYSISNILARKSGNIWVDEWIDANNQIVNVYSDKDALKIIAEDGVPARDMLNTTILIGEDLLTKTDFTLIGPNTTVNNNTIYAEINANINGTRGFIGPRIEDGASFTIQPNVYTNYLYYPGTAPSPVKLSFDLVPQFNAQGYLTSPRNSFVYSSTPYNTFCIEGKEKQEFKFTTPSIYTGYNRALKIFREMSLQSAWADISSYIKTNVLNYYARKWALMIVAFFQNSGSQIVDTNSKNYAIEYMQYFLQDKTGHPLTASFTFDAKNGSAIADIQCREVTNTIPTGNWQTYGNITTLEDENVGDMLRSSFLYLKERNLPDSAGRINEWTSSNKTGTHRFYHNVQGGLSNIIIEYKYYYY